MGGKAPLLPPARTAGPVARSPPPPKKPESLPATAGEFFGGPSPAAVLGRRGGLGEGWAVVLLVAAQGCDVLAREALQEARPSAAVQGGFGGR